MDFSELKGKKVSYVITTLSHDGGGWITNAGLTNVSGSISDFTTEYMTNLRDNIRDGWDSRLSYRPRPDFRPTVFRSSADINYFNAFLTLKMRMNGLHFMPRGGDATLFILVDILGTNLKTEDSLVAWTNKLKATCEFTYYAVDNKTGKMLYKPRSVSGVSEYVNHNSYFNIHNGTDFKMAAVKPTGFPLDEKLTVTNFESHAFGDILAMLKSSKRDDKDDSQAKLELADSHINARNFGAAEALINEVAAEDPDNPNLSAVRSRLGNELQLAIEEIKVTIDQFKE